MIDWPPDTYPVPIPEPARVAVDELDAFTRELEMMMPLTFEMPVSTEPLPIPDPGEGPFEKVVPLTFDSKIVIIPTIEFPDPVASELPMPHANGGELTASILEL
jgi:hypothetical protein